MHICFLCSEYPPGVHGGVGSVTQTLARALVDAGQDVSVVGMYDRDRVGVEDDRGVHVIRLPHTSIPSMGFLLNGYRLRATLKELDRQRKIDIIEGPELSLAGLSQAVPGVKVIRMHGGHHFFATTLGNKLGPWRQWQERRSFGTAESICSVSRYVGETTRSLLHLGDRPIRVLPNPVDTSLFYPRRDVAVEEASILFFGTLCEKKGVGQLVQAMPQVIAAVPRAELWIFGRDTRDRRTGKSYQQMLSSEISGDLAGHIHFNGPAEHKALPEIIAKSTICVFPSHMEAHGVVLLEAMAVGKPIVTSLIEPCRETVDDGKAGLVCDARDPASIADAIIRLLKDGALREQVSAAARRKVVEDYSIEVMIRRNIEFYRGCLRQENSHA